MSSPLDGRIRAIAREEAASVLGTPADGAQGGEELQQQITDLHEHLHHAATTIKRLEGRLDALEEAAGQTDQAQATPRRAAARKRTSE
ncbi:hypothetical protein PV733_37080 [Streptomyces europaeiscabiei]|uniref:hypothetical protein n=1 Tax=Streptomyces europaeiscabiei TaxID=146819 RepID=UPI0029BD6553|nr:hypothetical protein [Streptomyces europaeiscabiei]MDX3714447.1 hypothetical protein [Streptomyces europaeiscabiei]MDX3835573.1 hypothetical protein [Streptomyces europaeiscabiei]